MSRGREGEGGEGGNADQDGGVGVGGECNKEEKEEGQFGTEIKGGKGGYAVCADSRANSCTNQEAPGRVEGSTRPVF